MRQLGALESAIMEVLWSRNAARQPMTVRDVLEALERQPALAYTTVMTVLDNLFRKGWVHRDRDGRAWRYSPVMSRAAYSADVMSRTLAASSDSEAVFLHLVAQLSAEEVAQLRAALRRTPKAPS